MKRLVLATLTLSLGLGGCTGGSLPPASSASRKAPAPAESAAGQRLPVIVLTADLSEPASRWQHVASISYGDRESELGLRFFPEDENPEAGLYRSPSSFAVADDGSLWILDTTKGRVAHFSDRGVYLGDVTGLFYERGKPRGRDVAISNGRLYLLEEQGPNRGVRIAEGAVLSPATVPRLEDHEVAISTIHPSPDELIGYVGGYVDPLGGGPRGFAELDVPGSGHAELVAGVSVAPDHWIDLDAPGEQDLEVVYSSPKTSMTQPLHVDIATHLGPGERRLDGSVGPAIEAVLADAVGILVKLVAYRGDEQVGQSWYLRIGMDREPLVWERLPDEHVNGELKTRHLAAGPDGAVYLMLSTKDGEEIYRRS